MDDNLNQDVMMKEKRSTWVRLKEDMKHAAIATTVLVGQVPTCRVTINVGLELIIGGVELLKMHGVTKDKALAFIERLFDEPGDIEEMHKGGKNEHLLRMAMKMVNGPIIRHTSTGREVEGEAKDDHAHDDVVAQSWTRLDPTLN